MYILRKFIILSVLVLFLASPAFGRNMGFLAEEADGSPAGYVYKLIVNNGSLSISSNVGTLTVDTAIVYKTIYIDAGAMVPCTTNGAQFGTHEYGTNDIDLDYYAFDGGATEERVQFKMPMPAAWDRGTIKVKFFWSSATASTADDTCQWGIKGQAFSNSDPIDAAFADGGEVIGDVLLAANGTDWQLSAATPAVTIGGSPALGDMIIFEIWRDTSVDNMAEDAWLFGALIQYKESNTEAAW